MRTSKQQDFEKFALCVELIEAGFHRTREGMVKLVEIAQQMNTQKPRPELIRILRDHTPDVRDAGR